jgi:CDP-diacylglycerol--serine O-phosphatidyltransferase
MKHLPNLLTLANLFCGCIAIVFILNSQPYVANVNGESYWVSGTEQAYWGGILICIAALFDVLDGLAARALQIYSPIGKDLDSLADLISFGVAPSMILFKMLWAAYIKEPNAMDISMWATAPAFLIACFGAIRLARFNVTADEQKTGFNGMPIPAVGLFVASFPLINFYNPLNMGAYMQNRWLLLLIIALLCWLMVSGIRFIKLMPAKWHMKYIWPQALLLVIAGVSLPLLKVATIPLLFVFYILLSILYKQPEEA